MKTIEFKLYLTHDQKLRIDEWLQALKWVWNRCIQLQENLATKFNYYHKPDKRSYPCCPISEYNHKFRESYPTCPIGWILADFKEDEPIFPARLRDGDRKVNRLNFFTMQGAFTHKEHPDKSWLTDVPSKFIDGQVKEFCEAWEAFTKQPNRKPPRYKGKNDKVGTLIHNNSKGTRVKGDFINIPKIGMVRVKGLSKRWDANIPFCPMKIAKKPSGYYLQLTGTISEKERKRKKHLSAGIDGGAVRTYTDELGKFVVPPHSLKNSLEKLAKLQRKAARMRSHPDNAGKKHHECQNLKKVYKRIAKIHEKIARQRRAFNHWQTTKLANQFETIYVEDLKLQNMVRSPKPKGQEDGKGYKHNGKKRKAKLNQKMHDTGLGQFYDFLGNKTKVIKVKPHNTSITCSACGYKHSKNRLSQALFECLECGNTMNADHNAAINIKKRGCTGV